MFREIDKLKKWKYYNTSNEDIQKMNFEEIEEMLKDSDVEDEDQELIEKMKRDMKSDAEERAKLMTEKLMKDYKQFAINRKKRLESLNRQWEEQDENKKKQKEEMEKEKVETHKTEVTEHYNTIIKINKKNKRERLQAEKQLQEV